MKKKTISILSSGFVLALAFGAFALVGATKTVKAVKADLALDDTTDCADADHYGWRTKTTDTEKAYGNTDLYTVHSPVYTDLQYSSNKSLQLRDKGMTGANNPIAVVNPFGAPADVAAGAYTWGDIKTKKIEFLMNFETEKVDVNCAILDLDTNAARLTKRVSISPTGMYVSLADSSIWYHFIVNLSTLSLEDGKSDSNRIGAFTISTLQATTSNFYMDQLRMVDAQTFDPSKATKPPFDDKISMYEDDDLARGTNFYGGKYSFTTIDDDTYSASSTSAVKITATANNSAYSYFFFDAWQDGVTLDKFGNNTKLVGYIKGSLANVDFISHAARFALTFSTSDHQKATGSASLNYYFENLVQADNDWYYMEVSLKSLVDKVDTGTYPLATTTVYGLRLSCGDYQVVTGDYYVIDSLMVIEYQDAYDLITDVTNVETCSTDASTVEGYKNRYLALNGYDRNMFDTTEVIESIGTITLGYKLNYMISYYGVGNLNYLALVDTIDTKTTSIIISVVALSSLATILVFVVIKKKRTN